MYAGSLVGSGPGKGQLGKGQLGLVGLKHCPPLSARTGPPRTSKDAGPREPAGD